MISELKSLSAVCPFFIPDQQGDLFALYYPPVSGGPPKQIFIHIPAFADEMNKSRRMISLQAREFAAKEYAVLIIDLFGTGDSQGDFSDANWTAWRQSLLSLCRALLQQGFTISLWALRCGTLLALDMAEKSEIQFENFLMWQPVLNGETFMMQFLRLRVASALMDRNAPREKTADLKKMLQDGHLLEVAGYGLNPELVNPLMAIRANQFKKLPFKKIAIIEVIGDSQKGAPINRKFVDELQHKDFDVSLQSVAGSPFWSTQEIVEVPELITASLQCI